METLDLKMPKAKKESKESDKCKKDEVEIQDAKVEQENGETRKRLKEWTQRCQK